jgi:hypothetical protein
LNLRFGSAGGGFGLFWQQSDEGVQRCISFADASQMSVDDLHWGDILIPNKPGELTCAQVAEF